VAGMPIIHLISLYAGRNACNHAPWGFCACHYIDAVESPAFAILVIAVVYDGVALKTGIDLIVLLTAPSVKRLSNRSKLRIPTLREATTSEVEIDAVRNLCTMTEYFPDSNFLYDQQYPCYPQNLTFSPLIKHPGRGGGRVKRTNTGLALCPVSLLG
jgi:hypothetical protein